MQIFRRRIFFKPIIDTQESRNERNLKKGNTIIHLQCLKNVVIILSTNSNVFSTRAIKTCFQGEIRFVPCGGNPQVHKSRGEEGFEFEVRKRWHARRRRCRWFESLRDRGKIVGQRPSRQRARVPANYEADTADKRSESAHAICIPRRETIVPGILWVRKLYGRWR